MAGSAIRGVRMLLPNWRMTLVRPSKPLPPNEVTFHVDPSMNKREIREYLEQIYNVRVAKVNTQNILGKTKKARARGVTFKTKDYKLAYVTLAEGTFRFPDNLFPVTEEAEEE